MKTSKERRNEKKKRERDKARTTTVKFKPEESDESLYYGSVAETKSTFFMTRAIAEDFGREDVLRTTFFETIIYAIFVILVTIYAIQLRSQSWFYVTKALQRQFIETEFQTINDVGITFSDIRTAADFWSYAETHLLGSIFWESVYDKRLAKKNENAMNILNFNKVLGVPRIRQVRVVDQSCIVHEYFRRLFLKCYGEYSEEAEYRKTFGAKATFKSKTGTAWKFSPESVTESLPYTGKISTYGGGGYYTDFPLIKKDARLMVSELKGGLWISRNTRAIFIDFSTYNANLNIFCVCKLVFEFPTSGGVLPSESFNSIHLIDNNEAHAWLLKICEFGLYIFAVIFVLLALRELLYFRLRYFIKFWSYIDWMIIVFTIIQCIHNMTHRVLIEPAIDKIVKYPDKYGNLEYFAMLQTRVNNIFAIYVFLVYVKIFKYLSFNRTMGQLNNTLKKCALDILGFSIMFFIIFLAFAELGYLLFGSQVENFSSFGVAMFTLLRTILGDFDYSEIEEANRILAPIYFLSYIFLVFFVLLNMFLAIINDTYGDVKTEIAIAPDEEQMTEYIGRRFRGCLGIFGYKGGGKSRRGELNITIRQIRDALRKCGFSDIEIEMFFARYNIDPVAEVGRYDIERLLAELERMLEDEDKQAYVHINDFARQQERLQQIDKTIGALTDQVKLLLLKLEDMDNVEKTPYTVTRRKK